MMNQTQRQESLCPVEAEVRTLLRRLAHMAPCSSDQHHRPSPPHLRHLQANGRPANEPAQARKWQREALFAFLERSCLLFSSMGVTGTATLETIAPAI